LKAAHIHKLFGNLQHWRFVWSPPFINLFMCVYTFVFIRMNSHKSNPSWFILSKSNPSWFILSKFIHHWSLGAFLNASCVPLTYLHQCLLLFYFVLRTSFLSGVIRYSKISYICPFLVLRISSIYEYC
jgi:hypothetical protein